MKRFLVRGLVASTAVWLAACGGGNSTTPSTSATATASSATVTASGDSLAMAGGSAVGVVDSRLVSKKGPVQVWVSLSEPSQAAYKSAQLAAQGVTRQPRAASAGAFKASAAGKVMADQMQAHRMQIRAQQDGVMAQLAALGATELARVHVAHNAIAVRLDAAAVPSIANIAGVVRVRPVIDYQLDLSETVPYVGAAAAQAMGFDGRGVRVAVLDSGIDYTHYNLGGPGTVAAYQAAYGSGPGDPANTTRDGLFPTAKVIGGYDFVGETWPNGALAPDDDPIDFNGHGTHVADIIAGHSADGAHVGVAPGASLYAVKVCSAVATACSGIALLEGMDYALDPNGVGDTSDAVDVINMSLGSAYGQQEDDLAQAAANAVALGVVVVAAAGNNGNLPFVVSSPSIAAGAISVAQTQVPSAQAIPLVITAPAALAGTYGNTQTVDWAPIGAGVSGNVVPVGRGCPAAGTTPEDPYTGTVAGNIVLIDRGACAVSLKVDRAAHAGAVGVLIGLVAPGDAVSFSFGGGTLFVPTLVIQQSLSTAIKSSVAGGSAVNAALSNANAIPLVGSMASTSARGSSFSTYAIKPEIGAPGASVSAVVGTGNGQAAFGGTSGATPMVSGAAAILLQAFPDKAPEQIKALLMNSAETKIYTNPATVPGELAPITRIGAGELRVDRALKLSGIARDASAHSASLSFGFPLVANNVTIEKKLLVENFSGKEKTYSAQSSFRYANDQARGAVRVILPGRFDVPAHGSQEIDVTVIVNGNKLAEWTLDGGPNGGNGPLLNDLEYDGYITLTSGSEKLSVPWQVLPRKSGSFSRAPDDSNLRAGRTFNVNNTGVGAGWVDVFALTGVSPQVPPSWLPQPGSNYEWIDMRAVGARLAAPGLLQFGINDYGRHTLPGVPAEYDIYIDTNRDGTPDYVLYNAESGGFGVTGQNIAILVNLATGASAAYYYTDADLNSANVVMSVPTAALGITDDTTIDFFVDVFDAYFTGWLTDSFPTMTFTPSMPRYAASGGPRVALPGRSSVRFTTSAVAGGDVASPSQTGLLLMYRHDDGKEADLVQLH